MNSYAQHVGSSSLTKDGTQTPTLGAQSLSCWITRETTCLKRFVLLKSGSEGSRKPTQTSLKCITCNTERMSPGWVTLLRLHHCLFDNVAVVLPGRVSVDPTPVHCLVATAALWGTPLFITEPQKLSLHAYWPQLTPFSWLASMLSAYI